MFYPLEFGLPDNLCSLTGLQKLTLFICGDLNRLPSGITRLSSLQQLYCMLEIDRLPKDLGHLSLRKLELFFCSNLKKLHPALENFSTWRC